MLLFSSVCFALRLQDPHVIFEVDSLILAKQLARHLPWACRSENLIALHQQCVHVCDSLSALHISWDIRHIYREFNQTADTLSNQAIDERDSNDFFSILVVFRLCFLFICFSTSCCSLPVIRLNLECQILCTSLLYPHLSFRLCQKKVHWLAPAVR